jgi:hypothetical protein
MRETKGHYAASFEVGKPLSGGAVALVRASKAEGERVQGHRARRRRSSGFVILQCIWCKVV